MKSKSENVRQSCSWSTRDVEGCINIISDLNNFLQIVQNPHIMPKDTSESEEVKKKKMLKIPIEHYVIKIESCRSV